MNEQIAEIRRKLREGYYRQFRHRIPDELLKADHYVESPMEASVLFRRNALGLETPVVLPGERIRPSGRTRICSDPAVRRLSRVRSG